MEKLTECEELVMKVIWESDEELSLMEVVDRVNMKYDRNWKPQTVSTFLARLKSKHYIQQHREGRQFFYTVLIPLKAYTGHITNEYVKFWLHENADEFLSALVEERALRADEISRINQLLANQRKNLKKA